MGATAHIIPGIGRRTRTALAHKGLSQYQCAQQLGIARNTISLLCAHDRCPNGATIARLARFLDVSTDWLLGLTEREQITRWLDDAGMRAEVQETAGRG